MANFFVRSRPTTTWAAAQTHALGVRRIATAAGLGMHFEVTTAGDTHATTEPTWDFTVGNTTADNTVVWTCRGSAAQRTALTTYVLGDRIAAADAETNAEKAQIYECTTAGLTGAGATIAYNTTVGGTTADGTAVWTCRSPTTWNNANITVERVTLSGSGAIAAGDTVYVGDEHVQTAAAAVTIQTSAGTRTNPIKIICVNDTGDPSTPTTLATTGQIISTGANNIIFNSVSGYCYVYGIVFKVGTGASTANLALGTTAGILSGMDFESCTIQLLTTATGSEIVCGPSGANFALLNWTNTTVQFSNASQGFNPHNTNFTWKNTPNAVVLGTAPTVLFKDLSGNLGRIYVEGVDLGNATNQLMAVNLLGAHYVTFNNCKLGNNTVTTGTHIGLDGRILFINCDSGAANTNVHYEIAQGIQSEELTIIKTSGASDGTTGFSWKIVTGATTPNFIYPFVSLPITQWQDTTGSSKTLTVEIVNDGVTLTDAEIWVEVEYLGSGSTPQASFIDDAKSDVLATAANQTSSSVTWTTTGLASPVKQSLSVTFTPQMKGPVIAKVYVARASTTVYVDPVATIA